MPRSCEPFWITWMIFWNDCTELVIFCTADCGRLADHTLLSCSPAWVNCSASWMNWVAFCSNPAECWAICCGWPVTIWNRKVLGPPEPAVASIALELGKSNIPAPLVKPGGTREALPGHRTGVEQSVVVELVGVADDADHGVRTPPNRG